MMKKVLCFVLIFSLSLSLFGCSENSKEQIQGNEQSQTSPVTPNNDGSSENKNNQNENEIKTDENESLVVDNDKKEDIVIDDEKESDKVNTEKNDKEATKENNSSNKTPSNTVTSEPVESDETENSAVTPSQPPSSSENNNTKKFKELKVEKINRPNAYYLSNGMDLITYVYGENVFQVGDSIEFKIVMTDNSVANYTITNAYGCDCEKKGNTLLVTANGSENNFWFTLLIDGENTTVESKDYSQLRSIVGDVKSENNLFDIFKRYGRKNGIAYKDGSSFDNYTYNDKSLSITGNTAVGDDAIYKENNPDWIEDVLWLVEQYKNKGFTAWRFIIYPHNVVFIAGN